MVGDPYPTHFCPKLDENLSNTKHNLDRLEENNQFSGGEMESPPQN